MRKILGTTLIVYLLLSTMATIAYSAFPDHAWEIARHRNRKQKQDSCFALQHVDCPVPESNRPSNLRLPRQTQSLSGHEKDAGIQPASGKSLLVSGLRNENIRDSAVDTYIAAFERIDTNGRAV